MYKEKVFPALRSSVPIAIQILVTVVTIKVTNAVTSRAGKIRWTCQTSDDSSSRQVPPLE